MIIRTINYMGCRKNTGGEWCKVSYMYTLFKCSSSNYPSGLNKPFSMWFKYQSSTIVNSPLLGCRYSIIFSYCILKSSCTLSTILQTTLYMHLGWLLFLLSTLWFCIYLCYFQKGIHLSIIAPRKIPALQRAFERVRIINLKVVKN